MGTSKLFSSIFEIFSLLNLQFNSYSKDDTSILIVIICFLIGTGVRLLLILGRLMYMCTSLREAALG